MKKLLLLTVLAFGLFSCSNSGDTSGNSNSDLGQVTFTYNGETISYSGENDPNVPETMNVYASTLQTYKTGTTSAQYFSLDSGTTKGAHFITIVIYPTNNQRILGYAKNGVSKVNSNSAFTTNPRNIQIAITEETDTYISGTFSSLDINGTFTKIPKKNY
jgi:hypothetical protein